MNMETTEEIQLNQDKNDTRVNLWGVKAHCHYPCPNLSVLKSIIEANIQSIHIHIGCEIKNPLPNSNILSK